MTAKKTMPHLGGKGVNERVPFDLYETPEFFVEDLLTKESFYSNVLEPACGNGRISKTLTKAGYQVHSSDIMVRDYPCEVQDFLSSNFKKDRYDIVTNPPFKLMHQFLEKSTQIAKNKIAIVGRVNLLEGVQRYHDWYENGINGFRLKKVLISSRRLNYISIRFSQNSAMMSCWFIFAKGYSDLPTIDWVNIAMQTTKMQKSLDI